MKNHLLDIALILCGACLAAAMLGALVFAILAFLGLLVKGVRMVTK